MKWQPYFPSPETGAPAPFLLVRAVNPGDNGERQPFYLNGCLDSGSSMSAIPNTIVLESEKAGIRPTENLPVKVLQGQNVQSAVRTFRFYLTVCVAPKLVEEFVDKQELEEYFKTSRPLYGNRPPCYTLETYRNRSRLGLRMVAGNRPYALIGRDIISQWTVLLHGPTGRFKVLLGRLCNWLVCSPGPRLARS